MRAIVRGSFCASFCVTIFALLAMPANAAPLKATVDLSSQRMYVSVEGKKKYSWRISTGKRGWETRPGSYMPFHQREKYYSKKWKMSLPYLTWIGRDGTAIHGTYRSSRLGRTASHGCIRLSISNARKFYRLVQRFGFWGTEVIVRR
jgi:lipoprotein-anchoring transpeptidase ErfK/SrfK